MSTHKLGKQTNKQTSKKLESHDAEPENGCLKLSSGWRGIKTCFLITFLERQNFDQPRSQQQHSTW